jgi:signal transduction histidine kinase
MLDPRTPRLPAQPPSVSPPAPFVERRIASRRAEDRRAADERRLLARSLDALAADAPAEERLAAILRLIARTAGARRVAVLADGTERRSAVTVSPGEDPADAEALAAWLDASARRSRAERAASGMAPVSIVGAGEEPTAESEGETASAAGAGRGGTYALLPVAGDGRVVLGFQFDGPGRAETLADRLPPALVRHAAVALAVVTDQLAAEREIAALRAHDAQRARFVSTVAHELRTPLTSLRGYLELILGDKVDDPDVQREFLARSRGIVGSMSELVGDLLELSQLEAGVLELADEPFSLAEATGRVASGLLPLAIERDIRLRTDLPPRLRSATGDRRRVEQILTNLAGNALKFAPDGGTVELIARFDGPVAIVVVRDDGPGIEPDDRGRIFDRFERLAAHESISGTGLGLPIARDLARRMGGDLDVASVPGSGSAFVLALPVPVANGDVRSALAAAVAGEEQGLEERAVLGALATAAAVDAAEGRPLSRRPAQRPDPRRAPRPGTNAAGWADLDRPPEPAASRRDR